MDEKNSVASMTFSHQLGIARIAEMKANRSRRVARVPRSGVVSSLKLRYSTSKKQKNVQQVSDHEQVKKN